MFGGITHHVHELILHIREELSWRRIFHIHGIVLGVAGWKVLMSHIGVTFLLGKIALAQLIIFKIVGSTVLLSLFPLGEKIVLAAQELDASYCGDAVVDIGEQCDDGNAHNYDGCSQTCVIESEQQIIKHDIVPPAIDVYPAFVGQLTDSLHALQKACNRPLTDLSVVQTLANEQGKDSGVHPLEVLKLYCIVDDYDTDRYGDLHGKTVTSKADAIKTLAKVHALGNAGINFDEQSLYVGPLPYEDVYADGWYIDYLIYAHDQGMLQQIGTSPMQGKGKIDILMPISKHEVKILLRNLGVDKTYSFLDQPGSFVSREEFAGIIVDAFADKFVDYRYLRAGNIDFYKKFANQLEGKSPQTQGKYLHLLSQKLRTADADALLYSHNLYLPGIDAFLKVVVQRATSN